MKSVKQPLYCVSSFSFVLSQKKQKDKSSPKGSARLARKEKWGKAPALSTDDEIPDEEDTNAVSYTHLDVYKRQVQECVVDAG